MKANWDVAIHNEDNNIGIGVILRGNADHILASYKSEKLVQVVDALLSKDVHAGSFCCFTIEICFLFAAFGWKITHVRVLAMNSFKWKVIF